MESNFSSKPEKQEDAESTNINDSDKNTGDGVAIWLTKHSEHVVGLVLIILFLTAYLCLDEGWFPGLKPYFQRPSGLLLGIILVLFVFISVSVPITMKWWQNKLAIEEEKESEKKKNEKESLVKMERMLRLVLKKLGIDDPEHD
jgi:hypothetical protein